MDIKAVVRAVMQTVILFGAGVVVPVAGQFVSLFTPVPLILVTVRSGWRDGIAAAGLAAALATALAGGEAGLLLLGGFGTMAAGIAAGMRLRMRPESAVLLGGGLPVAVAAAVLVVYAVQSGAHPVAAVEAYLHASVREAVSFYERLGLRDMVAVVAAIEDSFVHYAVRLLPGIALATSLVQAACCFGVARFLQLRSAGAEGPPQADRSLALWHAPDVWVWGLIVALGCAALPLEAVKFIGLNAAIVYVVLYSAQGMAVIDFALRRAGMSSLIRGVLHAVILALPSVLFLPPLGIVDIWADLRKVRAAGGSEGPSPRSS